MVLDILSWTLPWSPPTSVSCGVPLPSPTHPPTTLRSVTPHSCSLQLSNADPPQPRPLPPNDDPLQLSAKVVGDRHDRRPGASACAGAVDGAKRAPGAGHVHAAGPPAATRITPVRPAGHRQDDASALRRPGDRVSRARPQRPRDCQQVLRRDRSQGLCARGRCDATWSG